MERLTAKEAKQAAYGKQKVIYEKKKLMNKSDEGYQYGTPKERKTKYYSSSSDQSKGDMVETLKKLGKAKEKNASNREAYLATENPKAKGKNFSKATISNVDQEAYNRVMKRAQDSGLSAKDAKKAIDSAIRTTSANLKTDLSKTAMRAKMQESTKKKKAKDKLSRGY
jgi:hypothetical protein